MMFLGTIIIYLLWTRSIRESFHRYPWSPLGAIKDALVRSKLKTEEFQPGSSNTFNRSNCLVDNFLDDSNIFTNADGTRVFNLRKGHLYCNSRLVVYKLRYLTFGLQYVGSTITKCRKRFNNYKAQLNKYA